MHTKFLSYLKENNEIIKTPLEIIDYITDITPIESDVPDYFFELIKRNNKDFKLKEVDVKDVINNDEYVREYVDSGEERYGENSEYEIEYQASIDDLNHPIVILNDKVIDGYSRLSYYYRNDINKIMAYVA